MKKKLLALFLCCVMVFSLVPVALTSAFATGDGFRIYSSNGTVAETVLLQMSKKMDLTAVAETGSGNYQWQIRVSGDVWANIVGTNGNTLELSYGLVANALDNDAAEIRCKLTNDVGNVSYSNIVTVKIQPDSTVRRAPAASPAVGTVISQAQPIGELVIVPADAPSYYNAPAANSEPVVNDTPANDVPADETPANDTPTPTTYAILINYQFADGRQAAPSWSATVATGSTYTQDIQSPVVVGYTPDQPVVHVNTSEAKTYTVTYQPAEVDFTVKHYQQNVSNDEYTLADTETKKGFTESAVGAGLAKTDYTGFYSLLYDTTTTIAADGSTVVEVYYDRYYYLMNFDLDGGYGVEPIYARYGTPIDNVGTPTKAGYSFSGWSLDGENVTEIPSTMPAENRTYKAVWEADNTAKVTVVFWGENADNEEYSYIKSAEVNVKPGTEFTYSEDGTLVCALEVHTHDDSCGYACGLEAHTHSLDECYTLSCSHVAHTLDCYKTGNYGRYPLVETTKPSQTLTSVGDGIYTYNEYYGWFNETHYYLNIGGKWYCAEKGSWGSGGDTTPISLNCSHTHTNECYTLTCTKQEHTHSDSCYNCAKTEHTHKSDCYMSGAGLDSHLWTFKESDTVTVAADGSSVVNVYYDRTEFTLTFKDGSSTVYTLKEKWGADISEHWPIKGTNGTTYDNGERWNPSGSNTYKEVLVYLAIMPAESFTLSVSRANYDTFIMHYMVETLPGESGTSYNGKTFKESFKVTANYNYVTEQEDFFDLDGFTQWASNPSFRNGQININGGGDVYFYYTRNNYTLTFNDGYNDVKSENVLYEAPLSTYSSYVPDVPSAYESGSVTFGGWYLNPECTGAEYKLGDHTMPADNVLLYAKWVPVSHTVKAYQTKDALENGEGALHTYDNVPHGTTVTPTPAAPVNGQYTFVGWFYISDTGEEKAFDFSMPVNRNLNLYAKWSSNTLMNYTIRYAIENADGTLTYIADDTTGSALAGSTKTFDAKTGTQLYDGYQSGYFPKVSSHSLTIDIDNPSNNEFTFIYVAKSKVEYTVRYLEKGTEKVLADPKTVTTSDAVVTEIFKQITGYAPDAYQKQLVLAAEGNEIIFWYVKDDVHAPVQVIHWTQNIEGDGYTEYQSSTNLNGVIGTEYSETPLTIAGFTYNGTKSNASGELTAAGLVLNLYYDRIEYPYEFRFVEKDSDPEKQLADSVTGSARYQAQVTQTAKTIPGYTLVSTENQAIHIAIEDGITAVKNVKTFYYTEQTVDIKYEVVGPNGCGTLDNYQDVQLKVTSGEVEGSTPTAADGFKFVGWYKDEDCTQPVDTTWVDANNKLTPVKAKNYGTTENSVLGYEAATYYAKFEYDVADLTITKQGWQGIDEGQSFIFDVTGPNGYSQRVVINGNGSVTIKGLKIGKYTVTEVTSWSWRYTTSSNSQSIELKPAMSNTVNFTNTRSNHKWLGGDAYSQNIFGNSN